MSQNICIAAPFVISKPKYHLAKRHAVTEIKQPLASPCGGIAFWSNTGDHLAARGDLQLLAGLDPLEEGGEVLPQIGDGVVDHAGQSIL